MVEIPISVIEPGNGLRLDSQCDLQELEASFTVHGQLSPILVRKHPTMEGKYETIFGNRRLEAAKRLHWTKIRAEIVEATDMDALFIALCENLNRRNLTDYEKALSLQRTHVLTGKTYIEIANGIGKSPAFVSLHIAMLHLFPSTVASDGERERVLSLLTERHARALSKITDVSERWSTAKLAIKANLDLRELETMCNREASHRSHDRHADSIFEIVQEMVRSANRKDSFVQIQAISSGKFESFPCVPQVEKMDEKMFKTYYSKVFPNLERYVDTIEDFHVRSSGKLACATFITRRELELKKAKTFLRMRVTMIFERENKTWKMLHSHWSTSSLQGLEILSQVNHDTYHN